MIMTLTIQDYFNPRFLKELIYLNNQPALKFRKPLSKWKKLYEQIFSRRKQAKIFYKLFKIKKIDLLIFQLTYNNFY